MTTLYLVGPSQVGKTVIAHRLAQEFGFEHRALDRLLKQRDPSREPIQVAQDWGIVGPLLEDAERSEDGRVLLDIGAGTQDMDRRHQEPRLEEWLRLRTSRVILLAGSPDEIFGRSRAHQGYRARFDELEFGPARQRIYAPRARHFMSASFRLASQLNEPATQSSSSSGTPADRAGGVLLWKWADGESRSRGTARPSRSLSYVLLLPRHDRIGDQVLARRRRIW